MLDGLRQALGAAGTVLDTPGSVMRGLVAAPFTGEWDRPLTGILDPERRVRGEEWTGDPWSGMAADMVIDPLNLIGGAGLARKLLNPRYDKVIDALQFGRGDREIGKSLWFTNAKDTAEEYAKGVNPTGSLFGLPGRSKSGKVVGLSLAPDAKIANYFDDVPEAFIEDRLPLRARSMVAGEFPDSPTKTWEQLYAAADMSDDISSRQLTRAAKDAGYQGVARPILGEDWLEYGIWDKSALAPPGVGKDIWRGLPPGQTVPNPRAGAGQLLAALLGYNAVRAARGDE